MRKQSLIAVASAVLALTTATTGRAQSYSNAVMALNPAAYWPLQETTAPSDGLYTATNSGTLGAAGNGYYETWWQTNGTTANLASGNSIVHVPGAIAGDSDTAMQQGAVGQYVVIPRNTSGVPNTAVTLTAPFTIEMWIYPTNGTANQLKPILEEGFNNVQVPSQGYAVMSQGVALGMYSSFLYFNTYNGAGTKSEIDTPTLALNNWYHIVATFDGTTKRLYTNGVQVATQNPPVANGANYVADPVSPLIVGGGNELGLSGGANVAFGGAIDEVAIYNGVLSASQVTTHYTAGTNSARVTPYPQVVGADNPSIYLRLDEPAFAGAGAPSSYPTAANYGSLGSAANGSYLPGTTPGAAGPSLRGFGSPSYGVALNGFNAGVDVGNGSLPAALNPTNKAPVTVAAWFKGNPSDAVGRFQTIVGHSDSSWRLNLDNNAGAQFNPGAGPQLQFSSVSDQLMNGMFVNDGNWHFVAGVCDGTNDQLYVDGVLAKSGTAAGAVINGSSLDVILGGDPQYTAPQAFPVGGGGRWFDGSISQVAFFTNALSSSQIQGLYSAAVAAPVVVSQPLSQGLNQGSSASIPAVVEGASPISYQWYKGSSPASGQTSSSLTFGSVATTDAGSYYLVANNSYGSVTSAVIQVTVFQTGTYAYAVKQLNPVAYWPLNETTQPPFGQYIATNSGSLGAVAQGYYGSWYQSVSMGVTNTFYATNNVLHTAGATGDGDKALLCNQAQGAGQYVVIPRTTNGVANSAVTIQAPFTMECWLMTTNVTGGLRPIINEGRNQTQVGAPDYTNAETGFSVGQYNNFFYVQLYNASRIDNNGVPELHVANLQTNTWYHVVATYDGSTLLLYSNGVEVANATASYVPDLVSPLVIGTGTDLPAGNGGTEFGGAVDDVAFYPTVLSQTQITNHYAASFTGNYSSTVQGDAPSIYLRLDEPAFSTNNYPAASTYPVAANYGSLGGAANGRYQPGTTPGVAGPAYPGFGGSKAVAINGFYGAVDIGGGFIPAALNPTGTQPQTVAAWFQANPTDARFQEIVSRGDSSWRLALNGNNGSPSTAPYDVHFNPGNNGSDLGFANISDVLTNGFFVNDGNWHMAAGVSDGTNAYLYIDGRLAKNTSSVTSLTGSTLDALLGGTPAHTTPIYNTPNIRYFNGQIAQVSYFTNALGAAQIQNLYSSAGVPLTIVSEPQSATFNAGSSASLSVLVSGSTPSYQWYSTNMNNGTVSPVAGQTGASLVFNPAALGNSGYYFVIANNAYNSVTSSVAQLTVVGPPVLTQSTLTDIRVFVGTTPKLSVSADGPSLSYQWSSNNVAIPGATDNSYTLTTLNTSSPSTNIYKCVITNSLGSATFSATVAVLAKPTAPYPLTVLADHPLNYFRLDEADDGIGNNGATAYDYAGGLNCVYSNTVLGQAGYSSLTDPNESSASFGQVAGSDSLAGFAPSNYLNFATSNTLNAEFSVEFWVKASFAPFTDAGLVAIGYGYGGEQFAIDCGANETDRPLRFYINGANGATYHVLSTFHPYDGIWHHVVAVCDEAGGQLRFYADGALIGTSPVPVGAGLKSLTSPLAIGSRLYNSADTTYQNQFFGNIDDVALYGYALTDAQVQAHYLQSGVGPTITQINPFDETTNQSATATFTVTAVGTAPLSYQWLDNNNNVIPNATNATLLLPNVQPGQAGTYTITVTNLYGSATTNATLTVTQVPQLVEDITPSNETVYATSPVTLNISASGSPPLTYRWYQDGTLIPGNNAGSYSFAALLGTHTYYVTVSNIYSGSSPLMSSTATITGMPSVSLTPTNFTDHMKITFAGYNRAETLSDFPVLVRLSTNLPGFNYAHFAAADGSDLRFTDSGGTRVLPHEIDEWNTNGESTVWVQVPALSGTNTFIWAYWGSASPGTAQPTANVWVPQAWEGLPAFNLVYHLKEGGFPYADSAGQNPALTGGVAPATNGMVGTGAAFNGSTSFLDAGTVTLPAEFTLSTWVNLSTSANNIQTVWANQKGGYGSAGFAEFVNFYNTADGDFRLASGDGTAGTENGAGAGTVSFGQWHLLTVAVSRTNAHALFFLDGNALSSTPIVNDFPLTADLNLGRFTNSAFYFNGTIDEARIQTGTNDVNWTWASYQTVAQTSSFQSYGVVTSTVPSKPSPVSMQFQVSNGNLVLSGSGGVPNGTYHLLSTTNVTLPVASWTPVATNSFDSSGNFSITNVIDHSKKQQFFLIGVPY